MDDNIRSEHEEMRKLMCQRRFFLPFLPLLIIAPCICADEPAPSFPVKDYIRGTMGEPLYVDDTQLAGKYRLRIENELRYCEYGAYWDTQGQKQNLDGDYSRFTDFLSIDFGLAENIDVGVRIPFIARNLKSRRYGTFSGEGFGDLLLRVRVDPFGHKTGAMRIALGTGVKIPTGEYSPYYATYPLGDLPTGTGSTDFSFMAYGSYDSKILELYADMGYVLTGEAKFDHHHDQNLGNVLSYDIAFVRAFAPFISGIVEFNGFTITASKLDEGWKTNDGQHKFTICPGIAISIPCVNLKIEGGFSRDLSGSNALWGKALLLRVKMSKQLQR